MPHESTSDTTQSGAPGPALNAAFGHSYHVPEAKRVSVSPPGKTDPDGVIRISGYSSTETYYHRDVLVDDRYSGELLDRKDYEDLNGGEKFIQMNYDTHVGSIGGLLGKIIAFLATLFCAGLPITGFIIWFDRESKKWMPDDQPPVDEEREAISIQKRFGKK